jgi:RHS repeat-associated protein
MGRSGRRSFLQRCIGQALCGLLLLQSSPAFTDPGVSRERQHWIHGTLPERSSVDTLRRAPEAGPAEEPAATPARSASLTLADPPSRPARAAAAPQRPAFPRDGNGPAKPEEKSPEPAAPAAEGPARPAAAPAATDSSRPPLPPGVKDVRSGRSLVPAALNAKAGSTSAIPLQTGWNLISLPRQAGDPSPAAVFGGAASRVFAYDACDTADPWKVWDPANPSGNDLTAITPQMGLWAEVPAALTLPVAGSEPATTTIHLCPGWNLIGAPFSQSRSVAGALAPIAGQYTRVFGFDLADPSDPWEVYDVSVPSWADTLQTFEPGKGYWLFATAETDLVLANQTTGPVVQIASPLDLSEVTTLTPVTGTVTGDLLRSWTLAYRAVGDTQWTPIGSGTGAVSNATLGTFDPTLLLNGPYQIQLTATDANNLEQSAQIDVNVEGQQKIGNFTLTFQDLDVPLSGLPIQILRTYDSRNKHQGDFGVGWTLGIHQGSYQNNRQPGEGWQFASGFVPCQFIRESLGHQTTIRLSDREIYRFKLSLSRGVPTQGGCFAQAGFDFVDGPVPGATLAILGGTQVLYQNGGGDVVDPGSFEIYEPQSVRLTTRDGRIFDLTLQQGVTRLQDPNGNQLSITPNGITHSSGRAVTFERDGQGQITKITDPEGNSLTYTYDAAGNLITVADRLQQTTQFTYDTAHLLLDIKDARGVTPLRNEYDASGRLLRTTDAFGKIIQYAHDVTNRQEVITDRLGHSRLLEYDARGNVVREVDANGKETRRTFDGKDNLLTETDPLGHTTVRTYSSSNDLASITDPLGGRTTYTYNGFGQRLTSVDARGKTTRSSFDTKGNILSVTDALSNVTSYNYDPRGNLLSIVDAESHVTQLGYDLYGNLIKKADPLGVETTYTYDGAGRQLTKATSRSTPAGNEALLWSYAYDLSGRLTKATDPDGTSVQNIYDPIGNIIESIDKVGRHTKKTYDDLRHLLRTEFPDGTSEVSTYDAEGHRLTSMDRAGILTRYEYDALGRQVKTIYADNSFTTNEYDDAGRLTIVTDPLGHTTSYFYDSAGRRTRVRDALGDETSYTYDAVGNQTAETDPRGGTTSIEYDDANRQVKTVLPNGSFEAVTYDRNGRKVSSTDAGGSVTLFTYDPIGNLIEVKDAAGGITAYTYDEQGSRIAESDANGHVIRFQYDKLGRKTQVDLPSGSHAQMTYDPAGNLSRRVDFRGTAIDYGYDSSNRLLTKSYPDGTRVSFTYDPLGQRTAATDARGTTIYEYDLRHRLTRITDPSGRVLGFGYDKGGNRTSIEVRANNQSLSTQYEYDELSRIHRVVDPAGRAYLSSYDENGNKIGTQYPNGVVTVRTFDSLNQLVNLVSRTSDSSVLQSYSYTLDALSHRSRIAESDGTVRSYDSDPLYRLKNELVTRSSTPLFKNVYSYDSVGNRLTQEATVGAGTPSTAAYTYDNLDRLVSVGAASFNWDGNGNLTAGTTSNIASANWDFENHLTETVLTDGTRVDHVYDFDGNRVRTTITPPGGGATTTDFLVDPDHPAGRDLPSLSQVVAEVDGSGVIKAYYVRGEELLSVLRPAGAHFYHSDGLGSVRLLTDETQTVTDSYDFSAFGTLTSRTGSDENLYLFAGEPLEPYSGLYYLRARWLDPRAGRFISRDPWPEDQFLPTTRHPYLYASADPIDFSDPLGLYTQSFGYAVEDEIELQYRADHPGQIVTYGKWARVGANIRLKPDILNHTIKKYNEVKPLSFLGVINGTTQMGIYLASLGSAGYSPDTVWEPRYQPIYPQGVQTWVHNVQGLLFYTDSAEVVNEFFTVLVTTTLFQLLRNPKFFSSALDELAVIRRLVSVAASTKSAELEGDVAIGVELGVYGGLP